MATKPPLSTGVEGLDALIGGYHIGDNVIVQVDVATPPHAFLEAALASALERGEDAFYVAFDRSPATVSSRLANGPTGNLTLVDCFTHGKGRSEQVFDRFYEEPTEPDWMEVIPIDKPDRPAHFHDAFDQLGSIDTSDFFIVDSLSGMAELWGEARVQEFYTHTCPRLFDTGAIALWVLHREVHSEAFRAAIGHTAQVFLELERENGRATLRVQRAEGRYDPGIYEAHAYEETADGFFLQGDT